MRDLAANLSTLYGHLPLLERAAAARSDGYSRVESWWDFDSATPPAGVLADFAASVEAADVHLIALNSHGGDRARGERGLASLPDRREEFRASIAGVVAMADRLGVLLFNVTAGNRDGRFSPAEQDAVAIENYRYASDAVAGFGGQVLIEALSAGGNPDYPYRSGYDVVELLEASFQDRSNVGLLFDTFHLAENGIDLLPAWRELLPRIKHLQLADSPGRGAPGTGGIDFPAFLAAVESSGYDGDISLEHLPHAQGVQHARDHQDGTSRRSGVRQGLPRAGGR